MSDPTQAPRRADAGFFSSARAFTLPVGPRIDPVEVRGYYIDFRVKAASASPPPDAQELHVIGIQHALGCYERYLAGDGEEWLTAALAAGSRLAREQRRGGVHDGGWVHERPFAHTFRLRPPWLSAMAQGEGASLLVRLHGETGEPELAEAAIRALGPLAVATEAGGAGAPLGEGFFPEEYPTQPPSFVLNGGIFALWGCHDVAAALGEESAAGAFEHGVATLADNIDRWDTGYWSRYDLFPHPVANVASAAYHALHINQLRAMTLLTGRPELVEAAARFEGYASRRASRYRAFLQKVAFRLAVPRNQTLARAAPWVSSG